MTRGKICEISKHQNNFSFQSCSNATVSSQVHSTRENDLDNLSAQCLGSLLLGKSHTKPLIHFYCSPYQLDVHKLVDHFKSFWLVIACAKEGTKCSCAILLAHKLESHSTPLLIPLTAQTIVRVGCGDVQETISNSKGFFKYSIDGRNALWH